MVPETIARKQLPPAPTIVLCCRVVAWTRSLSWRRVRSHNTCPLVLLRRPVLCRGDEYGITILVPLAPAGGGKGGLAPPLEFEKMTSYIAVLQNTLKCSIAPSALALDTLYFSLKRREKSQMFLFAPSARRKMVDLLYGAPKTCRLFMCR